MCPGAPGGDSVLSFKSAVVVAAVAALGVASFFVSSHAQSARTGVVTTLEGRATVARVSLETPAPLKFKDEIYTQDKITTDKDSLVRVLLGGKALITIRERTVVTIRETPGVATIKVNAGRIKVDVIKARMKGEIVDIVTPNAVGTVRGTVVVAEVEGPMSTLTVLTGIIDVTRIDPASGKRVGAPVPLGTLQQMTIIGNSPLAAPRRLTPEGAQQLGSDFKVAPNTAPHGGKTAINHEGAISDGSSAATAIVLPGAVDGGAGGKGTRIRERRDAKGELDQPDAPDASNTSANTGGNSRSDTVGSGGSIAIGGAASGGTTSGGSGITVSGDGGSASGSISSGSGAPVLIGAGSSAKADKADKANFWRRR